MTAGGPHQAMALLGDDEAVALRELFAAMDAADEAGAVSAMNEAALFLRQHELSFRQIIQQIEARGLLLPSKIGTAVQLMDSTTLSEAESALAGARRLMRSCGLTFTRIIEALDQEPADAKKIEQLKWAFRIEVERSREMEAELQFLRARVDDEGFRFGHTPLRGFVFVATLLFGVLLATSILSTITGLFRPENATADVRGAAMVQPDEVETPRPHSTCWRDRSIHGPCF